MNEAQQYNYDREYSRGARVVIEHCIDGYYLDTDLMRGWIWVTVVMGDGKVAKKFQLKDYDRFPDVLNHARGWRDALLGAKSTTRVTIKPKVKRIIPIESPAVELARRDVAGAMRKYGHVEDPHHSQMGYIP